MEDMVRQGYDGMVGLQLFKETHIPLSAGGSYTRSQTDTTARVEGQDFSNRLMNPQ